MVADLPYREIGIGAIYSPQSSASMGAGAKAGGSRETTSKSTPQSGQTTISLSMVSFARETLASHSGQVDVMMHLQKDFEIKRTLLEEGGFFLLTAASGYRAVANAKPPILPREGENGRRAAGLANGNII
jgi:hypothetical protein